MLVSKPLSRRNFLRAGLAATAVLALPLSAKAAFAAVQPQPIALAKPAAFVPAWHIPSLEVAIARLRQGTIQNDMWRDRAERAMTGIWHAMAVHATETRVDITPELLTRMSTLENLRRFSLAHRATDGDEQLRHFLECLPGFYFQGELEEGTVIQYSYLTMQFVNERVIPEVWSARRLVA